METDAENTGSALPVIGEECRIKGKRYMKGQYDIGKENDYRDR